MPQPGGRHRRGEHGSDLPCRPGEFDGRSLIIVVPMSTGRIHTEHRHPGQPVAARVADRLDDSGLVGHQHLGHEAPPGPLAHVDIEHSEIHTWSLVALLGKNDRPFAPPRSTRVDETGRDQRGSLGVVTDGGDHAVVLVAEVGVQPSPVTEASVRSHVVRDCGDTLATGDHVRPVRPAFHRFGRSEFEGEHAHVHLGVEHLAVGPPRPEHVGPFADRVTDGVRVA